MNRVQRHLVLFGVTVCYLYVAVRFTQYYSGEHVKEDLKNTEVIPVLLLACNRPKYLRRVLQQLQRVENPRDFPVTVSLDCNDSVTKSVARQFGVAYMEQPDQSKITNRVGAIFDIEGYSRISRHYGWALRQMVNYRFPESKTLIIMEDDLNFSADLFQYFSAFSKFLQRDESLLCVSGFNDNGKPENIDHKYPCQLWRTDFFPGLGWMTTSAIVKELIAKWPLSYWDDWLRNPENTLGRSCIRPEVSKTTTFGRTGVSSGQYFETHLAKIELNQQKCLYEHIDQEIISKRLYDERFSLNTSTARTVTIKGLTSLRGGVPVKLICNTTDDWHKACSTLGLMCGIHSGGVRNIYNYIVVTFFRGSRVYIDLRKLAPKFIAGQ